MMESDLVHVAMSDVKVRLQCSNRDCDSDRISSPERTETEVNSNHDNE